MDWHSDLRADGAGYYVYLPGVLHWGFRAHAVADSTWEKAANGFTLDRGRDRIVTKYSCGTALLVSPFYLAAESITGWGTTDGFSAVHRRCLELCAVFYWMVGSVLLGIALQRWIPARPWVAPVVLAAIGLGSNVFYYAFRMPAFSHVHSFFAVCVALYALLTGVLVDDRPAKRWLFFVACALIVLIRPVDAIIVLGLYAWVLLVRPAVLRSPWTWVGQAVCMVLLWAPQLAYWHFVHGSWIVYSYGDEGFTNWASPHVLEFMFAARNGWLPYAPVLLTLSFGIAAMWRPMRRQAWLVLAILGVAVYVSASWWVWTYGCGYGARPMVQYMPFVAFPLWAFLTRSDERSVRRRYAVLPLLALLVFVSYRAALQYDWCFFSDDPWDWDHYGRNIARAFIGGM